MTKLLPNTPKHNQPNLFQSQLRDMLDTNDPLVALAETIDWTFFEDTFAIYDSEEGRPVKLICLMVGLLLLKQIENLSDGH